MRTPNFSGTVIPVPLEVQDHETKDVICNSRLYLHTVFSDGVIKITGLIPEGCFQTTLEDVVEVKQLDDFSDDEWRRSVGALLQNSYDGPLVLKAKFTSSKDYYQDGKLNSEEELELIEEFVTLEVTEAGTLAKIYGSVRLQLEEEDEVEQDMFNWLDFVVGENETAKSAAKKLEAELKSAVEQNAALTHALAQSADTHTKVVSDLEDKFYQLLQSKKQKIMELESSSGKTLEALNEPYLKKNQHNLNKPVINLKEIPDELDEVYTKRSPRKKRKLEADRENPKSDNGTPKSEDAADARRTMSKLSDKQLTSEILGKSDSDNSEAAAEATEISNTESDSSEKNVRVTPKVKVESATGQKPKVSPGISEAAQEENQEKNKQTSASTETAYVSDSLNETSYSSD